MNLSIDEVLTRGVSEILPSNDGLKSLMKKKKIKLYQGFDPSAPSLHLGNLVGVMKLRQFQKLGHKVIFLIGDFSGMIGDPTDKLATRKKLTREEVLENAKVWKNQVSKLLDFEGENPAEVVFNSNWLDKLEFSDVIELTSNITVQQLLERDMFQERVKTGSPIYLHEFLYPVVTGYDSVALEVDLEIGGNDQTFNILVGRTLEKAVLKKDKYALTMKLLVDKEGKKVGKTTGNALFVSSGPNDFYGGIMSFPDDAIPLAFELLTEVPLDRIEEKVKKDPMNEKKRLAFEIVKLVWGDKEANEAQKYFEDTVQKKVVSKDDINALDIPTVRLELPSPAMHVLTESGHVSSKTEYKRLVAQNAIEVNNKVVKDLAFPLVGGEIVKIGKKKIVKIEK